MFHFTHSFLHPSLCCIALPSVGFYRSWAEPVSHLFSWRFRITQLFFNLLLKWSSWIDTLAFFSQTVGVCFHVWVDFFLSVLIYLCLVSVFEDGSNKGKSCHFFSPLSFLLGFRWYQGCSVFNTNNITSNWSLSRQVIFIEFICGGCFNSQRSFHTLNTFTNSILVILADWRHKVWPDCHPVFATLH